MATHRHTPEIEEQLSYAANRPVRLNFTPHLVPMNRGILVTAYASLKKDVSYEEVKAVYDRYYEKERFVRVLPKDSARRQSGWKAVTTSMSDLSWIRGHIASS